MVRWRYCLVLAMLLLLPTRTGAKMDDEDDEDQGEDADQDEDDDDDEEEEVEQTVEKIENTAGRRAPAIIPTPKALLVTRTAKKRPLECYVCAYKPETPIKACLDPTKYRVHTMTCHSPDDKCFTSVLTKGSSYDAVVRGCRSGCVGSPDTSCCELNRCNNQALALPEFKPKALLTSKSNKSIPPTVLFFVTILLVLQTVVKVAIV